jgi:hypothetical protein
MALHSSGIQRTERGRQMNSRSKQGSANRLSLFLGFLPGNGRQRAVALLGVQFRRFGAEMNRVLTVSVGEVWVVCGLFVLRGLVVFRCLLIW